MPQSHTPLAAEYGDKWSFCLFSHTHTTALSAWLLSFVQIKTHILVSFCIPGHRYHFLQVWRDFFLKIYICHNWLHWSDLFLCLCPTYQSISATSTYANQQQFMTTYKSLIKKKMTKHLSSRTNFWDLTMFENCFNSFLSVILPSFKVKKKKIPKTISRTYLKGIFNISLILLVCQSL